MAEYLTVKAFEVIARSLSAADVRFMVVGGVAMQAHGSDRLTYDLDIVVQLDPANVLRAFEALKGAGYHPSVPIAASQFADAQTRERFRRDKKMTVLNFWSDRVQQTKLDVFVAEPFDFDAEYALALRDESLLGIELRFPRAEILLQMKQRAGRPKDLHDIAYLENLLHR